MLVDTIFFGNYEVENEDITDNRRYVCGLRDAHYQRLDACECLVVNQDGMS